MSKDKDEGRGGQEAGGKDAAGGSRWVERARGDVGWDCDPTLHARGTAPRTEQQGSGSVAVQQEGRAGCVAADLVLVDECRAAGCDNFEALARLVHQILDRVVRGRTNHPHTAFPHDFERHAAHGSHASAPRHTNKMKK